MTRETRPDKTEEAAILAQALPYMLRYDDRVVVVKYGGHAMGDDQLARAFARDIVLLRQSGVHPIVVHGGGPQIGKMLERLNIQSEFKDGLRVTDQATVDVVEMVLAGAINKQIVTAITQEGGRAIGLCGKDANMVTAKKLRRTKMDPDSNIERIVDLGFVGEPSEVKPEILHRLISEEIIPVIAPIAAGEKGDTFNINADTFAGAIASAMDAKRFLLLTDVEGVLGADGELITDMDVDDARKLIEDGVAKGGMIPKLETAISAAENGVEAVVIVNGKTEHAVLLELFTEHGAGSLIHKNKDEAAL
ncbi:acetylglutamate kinase [Maritalea mediterranea]|uniref:Acetylglutamate kinase n=1 Tax=Maritalea mediterranea TaxID=2909667 RepID=A0ABS9E3X3_9HYPH|nr:acetylglutamate kinase [Maritalea mediterranea]MCF4097502.1 acetylglutamate kinase [Maritalea mediterranea]